MKIPNPEHYNPQFLFRKLSFCHLTKLCSIERDMETEVDVAPRTTEMDIAKKGPEGVPEDVLPVLLLFCAAYSHVLVVLDDEEFYEHQVRLESVAL